MEKLVAVCVKNTTIDGIKVGNAYNVEHDIDYKVIYNETDMTFESAVGNKDWFNEHFQTKPTEEEIKTLINRYNKPATKFQFQKGEDMNNNEYVLECTSISKSERIIDKYPILKNYNTRIDYPYPNSERARLIIKVDDLIKFHDDIGEEIIIGKENIFDDETYALEIYDGYRE